MIDCWLFELPPIHLSSDKCCLALLKVDRKLLLRLLADVRLLILFLSSSSPSDADKSCSNPRSEHQLSSELMVRDDIVCSSLLRFGWFSAEKCAPFNVQWLVAICNVCDWWLLVSLNARSGENGSDRRDPIVFKWFVALLACDNGNGSSQEPEFNFGSSAKRRKGNVDL